MNTKKLKTVLRLLYVTCYQTKLFVLRKFASGRNGRSTKICGQLTRKPASVIPYKFNPHP